jgi:hypothetical protein
MNGNYDEYTIPELAAYILWAIVVNKGVMPPINRSLGLEMSPATSGPVVEVSIQQNGNVIPETDFPGTIIVGISEAGNVPPYGQPPRRDLLEARGSSKWRIQSEEKGDILLFEEGSGHTLAC